MTHEAHTPDPAAQELAAMFTDTQRKSDGKRELSTEELRDALVRDLLATSSTVTLAIHRLGSGRGEPTDEIASIRAHIDELTLALGAMEEHLGEVASTSEDEPTLFAA